MDGGQKGENHVGETAGPEKKGGEQGWRVRVQRGRGVTGAQRGEKIPQTGTRREAGLWGQGANETCGHPAAFLGAGTVVCWLGCGAGRACRSAAGPGVCVPVYTPRDVIYLCVSRGVSACISQFCPL